MRNWQVFGLGLSNNETYLSTAIPYQIYPVLHPWFCLCVCMFFQAVQIAKASKKKKSYTIKVSSHCLQAVNVWEAKERSEGIWGKQSYRLRKSTRYVCERVCVCAWRVCARKTQIDWKWNEIGTFFLAFPFLAPYILGADGYNREKVCGVDSCLKTHPCTNTHTHTWTLWAQTLWMRQILHEWISQTSLGNSSNSSGTHRSGVAISKKRIKHMIRSVFIRTCCCCCCCYCSILSL